VTLISDTLLSIGSRDVRPVLGASNPDVALPGRLHIRTVVSTPWSRGRIHWRARLARCRLVRFTACSARRGSPWGQVGHQASPVPKYISSGVYPRNAECGSTRLCSST